MVSISAVIPLYNKGAHVLRALGSIRSQTSPCHEIIVVDDGSEDQGPELVSALDWDKVKLIRQKNAGVSAARNAGIDAATGDYLAFLDADDAWEAGFLAAIRGLIQDFPQAGAFATRYMIVDPDGRWRRPSLPTVPSYGPWRGLLNNYFEILAKGNTPICSSAVCVRKKTFDQVGHFKPGARLYEDLDLWNRIALRAPVAYSNEVGAVYFRDSLNRACIEISPGPDDIPFRDEILRALENKQLVGQSARYARMALAKYQLMNSFKAMMAGNKAAALDILAQTDVITRQQTARKRMLYILSVCPHRMSSFIWRLGTGIQGITSR